MVEEEMVEDQNTVYLCQANLHNDCSAGDFLFCGRKLDCQPVYAAGGVYHRTKSVLLSGLSPETGYETAVNENSQVPVLQ